MKRFSAWRFAVICLVALGAFAASGALAQEEGGLVGGIPLQFSLVPPGAKSLGLGGAFIGAANDATAAWSNPAGLMNLLQPEVSLEFRYVETAGGKEQFSIQNPPDATEVSFQYGDVSEVSFASWVLPKERWALAVYYHELASQEASSSGEGGKVGAVPFKTKSQLEISIPGIGASFAFAPTDNWRLGVGATYYEADLFSSYYSLNQRLETTRLVEGDDGALGGIAGIQWRNETISVGAVYRLGPEFSTTSKRICGPYVSDPAGTRTCNNQIADTVIDGPTGDKFKVPDSYGIGMSWQATPSLSVAVDIVRTDFSVLSERRQQLNDSSKAVDYVADDATEPHLGLEYGLKLANERFLYFRAGGWLEEDHRLRYQRPNEWTTDDNCRVNGPYCVAFTIDRLYPSEKEDAELHTTFGLGLTLGLKFQLDFAVDLSGLSDTASLSGVYRF